MPRLPRPTETGLVYHAINWGNNRADVFDDDDDRLGFLEALAKAKQKYPFRLLGYCLMTNHFHLLVRPEPRQSISRILQSVTVAHTWGYHKRHQTVGHVWQGRFKSPVVQDDGHLLVVLRYIEANPLRAGLVADPAAYPWSSFPAHGLGLPDPLLDLVPLLDELGRTPKERQSRWRRRVSASTKNEEVIRVRESLRTGKPLGTEDWVVSKASALGIDLNPRPRGRPPIAGTGKPESGRSS
jgi:putative transposase